MAVSKKDLAQKIAIMQVANATNSAAVYSKSGNSDVWAKNENPMFNWGISDYKVVTDYSSLLNNPENTTLNFTDLVSQLNYLERGKNLKDEVVYAKDNINSAKDEVIFKLARNLNIDCTKLDKASLSKTELFKLISDEAGGDNDIINAYITELQTVARTAFRESLVAAANKLVIEATETYVAGLPENDAALYTNNAPTIDHLKDIVKELAAKVEEIYPTTEDGSIIELEKEGITLRFWKNIEQENVLTVSYDLAKATIGASPEYGVATDPHGNVTYSEAEVTKTELNIAIANAIATAEYRDVTLKEAILKLVEESETSLHSNILSEVDQKIADNRDIFLKDAKEAAEQLDEAFHQEINGSLKRMVLDMMYPIGTLYWSSKNTNPHTLFGGEWKRIKDAFIYAAGDADTVNATGGSKTTSLGVANLPAHNHTVTITTTEGTTGTANEYPMLYKSNASNDKTTTSAKITVTNGGNGKTTGDAFNNMPPYIVKYCWERIN